jgi:(1->4)-alpha-D-glucan 1-alpha-D-glucosylmutase
MCIGSDENHRWNDVLENGPSSPLAGYFDVDWHPVKEELENRVLLPVLGEPYGTVLESGDLRVTYHEGAFGLSVYGRQLPLDPKTYGTLLNHRFDAGRFRRPARDGEHTYRTGPPAGPHRYRARTGRRTAA